MQEVGRKIERVAKEEERSSCSGAARARRRLVNRFPDFAIFYTRPRVALGTMVLLLFLDAFRRHIGLFNRLVMTFGYNCPFKKPHIMHMQRAEREYKKKDPKMKTQGEC